MVKNADRAVLIGLFMKNGHLWLEMIFNITTADIALHGGNLMK